MELKQLLPIEPTLNVMAEEKGKFAERHQDQRGWCYRYLPQFKTVNGKRFQLHATRGWKCIGRAA